MKYLILVPLVFYVALSFLIGCIFYLWKFSPKQFRLGFKLIESKLGFFEKFVDSEM